MADRITVTPGLGRRRFLTALGASTAALPLLPLFDSHAEASGFPRRIVLMVHPDGLWLPAWRPSGGEHDFVLSDMLSSLAPYRQDLLVLDGVDLGTGVDRGKGYGHSGIAGLFTGSKPIWDDEELENGWASGPSVDQVIAGAIGGETAFASIQTGVICHRSDAFIHTRAFHAGAQAPLDPEIDPRAVFDRLFGDFTSDPAAAQRRIDGRTQVMDATRAEIAAISGKLGAADRHKLEAHLDGLRALEKRLHDDLPAACAVPDRPADLDPELTENLEAITDTQLDLIVQALACDRTRVVGFQWGREASTGTAPWIGSGGVHTVSHEITPDAVAYMTAWGRWQCERMTHLLDGLAAVPEGNGSMLDHTIVVWTTAMGSPDTHSSWNLPTVVFDGTGYFDTGRYLRWGTYQGDGNDWSGPTGVPHNKLLVSLCHAMGLADVTSFGNLDDPDLMTGPLPGLT